VDEKQLFPETLILGRLAPPLGGSGGGAVETLVLTVVKGVSGLGLDLVPRADGAVIVTIVRPYDFGPGADASSQRHQHPADKATPSPLLDGDEIVAVNNKNFYGDFETCKSMIRSSPENLTLTITRVRDDSSGSKSAEAIDANAPLVVGKSLEEWNVALGATSVFVSASLVEVSLI
jgi:hypothetical protein